MNSINHYIKYPEPYIKVIAALGKERYGMQRDETAFKLDTNTRKAIHTTLITTYGLRKNAHSGIVQSVVTMDDLFV